MSEWRHLSRRFVTSLSRRPPPADDERWAKEQLLSGERAVWDAMANVDRRHALVVARRLQTALGADATRPAMAAALLHDCGKTDAAFGTASRVVVTLWGKARGEAARRGEGRVARYLDHECRGARALAEVGSDPLTVALVACSPEAPAALREALAAADNV
jgi:hypothetical protein